MDLQIHIRELRKSQLNKEFGKMFIKIANSSPALKTHLATIQLLFPQIFEEIFGQALLDIVCNHCSVFQEMIDKILNAPIEKIDVVTFVTTHFDVVADMVVRHLSTVPNLQEQQD